MRAALGSFVMLVVATSVMAAPTPKNLAKNNRAKLGPDVVLQIGPSTQKDGGKTFRTSSLLVVMGAKHAVLVVHAKTIESVTRDDHDRVTIVYRNSDSLDEEAEVLETTGGAIRARVFAAEGEAFVAQHDLAAAERAFARAHELQHDLDSALALVAVKLERSDLLGGTAVLAPFATSDPLLLYARLVVAPKLAPYLDTAPLVALRAPQRGDAEIVTKGGELVFTKGALAWSERYQLFALIDTEYSLEYRDHERIPVETSELVLVDKTGKRILPLGFVGASRLLADLGFSTPTGLESAVLVKDEKRGVTKARFDGAKLGLVIGEKARVFRGDRQLAEQELVLSSEVLTFVDLLHWAAYVPAQNLIVYKWRVRFDPASCNDLDRPSNATRFGFVRLPMQ